MNWRILFLSPLLLFGDKGTPLVDGTEYPESWFTGPLIAPAGNVIQGGHFNIQPYIFAYAYTATYGNSWETNDIPTRWSINPQVVIQVGLTKWMDFQFIPDFFWNYSQGKSNWTLGDWIFELDFQLHEDELPHKSWLPSIKLSLLETFPTGNYNNLDPSNFGTDLGGRGSWITGAILVFAKVFHMYDIHYLNSRLALSCNYASPVRVKGLNAYGGGTGAKGTAYPGLSYEADLAFEYNLTQNWALALDIVGNWAAGSRFSGRTGTTKEGRPATNVLPASVYYSLAPAIEYNWSKNLGIIAGAWFSVAGKNIQKFSSAVIAVNYYN